MRSHGFRIYWLRLVRSALSKEQIADVLVHTVVKLIISCHFYYKKHPSDQVRRE